VLAVDDPANLELWSPWVRASIIDFELFSRIGFVANPAPPGTVGVRHLDATPGSTSTPGIVYTDLATFTRPTATIFKDQLELVNHYADLRPDRAIEIMGQLSATTTFIGSIAYLHPDRTRWTLELIGAAFRLAGFVEMRLKHALGCRRPLEYSAQVQPMILTPAHGSLPSGHATEAFIASTVLWALLRDSNHPIYSGTACGEQFMRLASRIAINRTIAGVHFPVDSVAGALLGLTLGNYFVARSTNAASYVPWRFDGSVFPGNADFEWRLLYDVASHMQIAAPPYVSSSPVESLDAAWRSPILYWLWNKALAEWS
jgi:membrane-associated phospholipid phosphatase